MKTLFAGIVCLLLSVCAIAQNAVVKRPRITGIDHVSFYTTAPEETQKLYVGILGLAAAAPVEPGEKWQYMVGSQWVGYSPAPDAKATNRMDHIAFTTEDVAELRRYLQGKGMKVSEIQERTDHSRAFSVSDPDGDKIEFVERAKAEAKATAPASACSRRLIHAGAIVRDREAADRFYRDILGFHVYWHGGHDASHTDWMAMQVPDGTDWFEYMLSVEPNPDLRTTGVMNHISLGVVNMDKAEAILVSHGWRAHGDEHQQVGMDGKKQLNLFDVDFTRIELMEFVPFQKPCCSDFQGKHPSETN
jgi:catechol 2,3-dioxygenase-like lactoylglutathione lyase family enzyme